MSWLLAQLARRAQAKAAPLATAYADANRLYRVVIIRPAVEPGFNRGTGMMVKQMEAIIFDGPARIRPTEPAAQIDLGDGPSYWANLTVSIGFGAYADPQIDDVIGISFVPPPTETGMLGRQYRVIGVTEGGHLATGYSLICTGVPSSRWTFAETEPDEAPGTITPNTRWERSTALSERSTAETFPDAELDS